MDVPVKLVVFVAKQGNAKDLQEDSTRANADAKDVKGFVKTDEGSECLCGTRGRGKELGSVW